MKYQQNNGEIVQTNTFRYTGSSLYVYFYVQLLARNGFRKLWPLNALVGWKITVVFHYTGQ